MTLDKQTLGRIEYEMAVLIRRATSAVNARKRLGTLDRSAYLLLRQISEQGPMGVKALADEFHLDVSTLSRQAGSLESKGFLKRVPDPVDKRACSFEITSAGQEQLMETRAARLSVHSELLAEWSEEDGEKLAELLTRFNRTFLRD